MTNAQYLLRGKPGSRIDPGPHLATNYVFLPVDPEVDGGKLKLRLHHEVDPAISEGFPFLKEKPDWKGKLVSNPVELQLRAGG